MATTSKDSLTLTDFLRARLDEAYVTETAPRRMRQEHVGVQVSTGVGPNTYEVGGKTLTRSEFEDQYLEPAPDPRALATIEVHRRILDAHPLTADVVPVHTGPNSGSGCETCHTVTAASVFDPDYVEALGPCDTLLALASIYGDHPDYREEWKL